MAAVSVMTLVLLGSAAPMAGASTEICPYVGIFGHRTQICIPLP